MQIDALISSQIAGIKSSFSGSNSSGLSSSSLFGDSLELSGNAFGLYEITSLKMGGMSEKATRRMLDDLSREISQKIGAALINCQMFKTGALDFKLDDSGQVKILSDITNKAAVEAAINSNSSLVKSIATAIGASKDIAVEEINAELKFRLDGTEEDDEEEEKKKANLLEYQKNLVNTVINLTKQVMLSDTFSMGAGGNMSYSALSVASSFTGIGGLF